MFLMIKCSLGRSSSQTSCRSQDANVNLRSYAVKYTDYWTSLPSPVSTTQLSRKGHVRLQRRQGKEQRGCERTRWAQRSRETDRPKKKLEEKMDRVRELIDHVFAWGKWSIAWSDRAPLGLGRMSKQQYVKMKMLLGCAKLGAPENWGPCSVEQVEPAHRRGCPL
jgi:hypothetical protein